MYPHSNFPHSFVILLDIHASPTHLAHCLQPTDCPCFWEQHYRSVGVRTHLAVSRFLTLEFAPAPVSQHSRWASGRHRTSASTSPCLPPFVVQTGVRPQGAVTPGLVCQNGGGGSLPGCVGMSQALVRWNVSRAPEGGVEAIVLVATVWVRATHTHTHTRHSPLKFLSNV